MFDFEQLAGQAFAFYMQYRFVFTGLAIGLIFIGFGLGKKKKPAAPARRVSLYEPESDSAREEAALIERGRLCIKGKELPDLPKPTPEDMDLAKQALGLTEVSAGNGRQLYYDGVKAVDLRMAMAGLRFYALHISEKEIEFYTAFEYERLGDYYWSLAKTHHSFECLELAFKSFHACYRTIYSEPSTGLISKTALKNLALLQQEMDAYRKT